MNKLSNLTKKQQKQVVQDVISAVESIKPKKLNKLLWDMGIQHSQGATPIQYLVNKGVVHSDTATYDNNDINEALNDLYTEWYMNEEAVIAKNPKKYGYDKEDIEDGCIEVDDCGFVYNATQSLVKVILQRELDTYDIEMNNEGYAKYINKADHKYKFVKEYDAYHYSALFI